MKNKSFEIAASLALLFLSSASLPAEDRLVLPTRVPESAKSQRLGLLAAGTRLSLSIGLPLRSRDQLTNLFQQVYDPGSTNFHRYLTPEQFAERFGPAPQDYQHVINYAKSNGLEVVRTFANRALVDVTGTVPDVEKMFHVKMGTYQHPVEQRQFFAPDVEPSVDGAMPILYVAGIDNYFIPRRNGHRVPRDANQKPIGNGGSDPSNGLYMGNDFRHAYLPGTKLTGAGQVVGLFELEGYTPSDIVAYENYAGLPNVLVTNVLESFPITLGVNSGNDEVASDIELAIAMAPGLTQVSVYEGSTDSSIISAMAEPSTEGVPRPNQISCSWGVKDDTSMEQGLIQLGLQGQSFMYAIGDNGAYTNGVDNGTVQDLFYMTAVGGTQLFMNGAGVSWSNEVVWDDNPGTNFEYFASTGGILSQVPIPFYQQGVNTSLNGGSMVNRNVPDVALVARDILIYFTQTLPDGSTNPGISSDWVGTSASSPLFAGLVALANQQAAEQGKPPVGFLNPSIYQIAEGSSYLACFHDITHGSNAWSNPATGQSSEGLYSAVPGYDLCTGWGTSAGPALIDALVGYSGPVFVNFNYTGTQTGSYAQPFSTLAGGVSAVVTGGSIVIETAGSSSETITISNAMIIIANNGTATVGK
jgi:subtilase family serine protease